jgi:hypothetical protein
MTTDNLARQSGADDVGFTENSHHPEPTTMPDIYRDEVPESDSETSVAAGFARLLKICTHKGDRLFPKQELALRITALAYLLDGGAVSIDQMAFEAGLKRSTLWRRIRLIANRTDLPIPHQKKTATALTGTVSEKSMTTTYEEEPFDE